MYPVLNPKVRLINQVVKTASRKPKHRETISEPVTEYAIIVTEASTANAMLPDSRKTTSDRSIFKIQSSYQSARTPSSWGADPIAVGRSVIAVNYQRFYYNLLPIDNFEVMLK